MMSFVHEEMKPGGTTACSHLNLFGEQAFCSFLWRRGDADGREMGDVGAAARGMQAQRQDCASELRRTISTILWQHQNGAKWRSVPSELGLWSRAGQTFIR